VNPITGASTGVLICGRAILWLRLALTLNLVSFIVIVTGGVVVVVIGCGVHVVIMIGRWLFFVVVVVGEAVVIRRRRGVGRRTRGTHIAVMVVAVVAVVVVLVNVVVEHGHELLIVEPVEVMVSDAGGRYLEESD